MKIPVFHDDQHGTAIIVAAIRNGLILQGKQLQEVKLVMSGAGAYANLGQCKLSQGFIEETIPLEEKAIHFSPRDPLIGIWYSRIGIVHLLQSRSEKRSIGWKRLV